MNKAEIGRAVLEASQGSPLERMLALELVAQLEQVGRLQLMYETASRAHNETVAKIPRFAKDAPSQKDGESLAAWGARVSEAERIAVEKTKRDAKRWNDLLELCGHLGDSSETTVTLSQDDACRTQHIKVGDRRFYGTSWGQVLDKALKGDES